jgi:predicted GIY-YIG superfamily endonuclease
MFTVYLLNIPSIDKYYVGYTNDLTRRLSEHKRKKLPAKLHLQGVHFYRTITKQTKINQLI